MDGSIVWIVASFAVRDRISLKESLGWFSGRRGDGSEEGGIVT